MIPVLCKNVSGQIGEVGKGVCEPNENRHVLRPLTAISYFMDRNTGRQAYVNKPKRELFQADAKKQVKVV